MAEYLPILIVGSIIGAFTIVFIMAFIALQKAKEKENTEFERSMSDAELAKRLFAYAKPHWKSLVLVMVIMLFSIFYDIVSPLIIGSIERLIVGDFELRELFIKVGIYAGILAVSMICTYFQSIILQRTGQKILSKLEWIFLRILRACLMSS